MTEYIVSIDPGKSSGCAVLGFDSSRVWLKAAHQVYPGVNKLRELIDTVQSDFPEATWISEKFSPRPGGGFGQGLDSTLPLVCEGVLIDRDLLPEYTSNEKRWRRPADQYLVGGKDKADKKKRQHRFLKDSGFYRTGKDLDAPDADDFRSACAHGLAYLARTGHKPTFDLIAGWE